MTMYAHTIPPFLTKEELIKLFDENIEKLKKEKRPQYYYSINFHSVTIAEAGFTRRLFNDREKTAMIWQSQKITWAKDKEIRDERY